MRQAHFDLVSQRARHPAHLWNCVEVDEQRSVPLEAVVLRQRDREGVLGRAGCQSTTSAQS